MLGIRAPFGRYSHGIAVPPGARLVFCSGQLGVKEGDLVKAAALSLSDGAIVNNPRPVLDAEEIHGLRIRRSLPFFADVMGQSGYARGDDTVQREVNLARSVDETLGLLQHRLRNVKVVKDIEAKARILGFPGQVDQVLMNLLTNAAQAIGDQGGTIRVSAHNQDARVLLTVSDDGPGIPKDVLPRIFDPFFTTKDVGEGSGLGLSIVHGIIDRHGGHIDVESQPGQGTKFSISFPLPPLPQPGSLP